jgi:DNA-binding FadR family transcriptional regulator
VQDLVSAIVTGEAAAGESLPPEATRRVLDAIEAGDSAAAEAAMRAHTIDAWQRPHAPTG